MRNGGSNKDEEAINAGDHEIKHLLLGRGDHEIEFLLLLLTPVREDETGDQDQWRSQVPGYRGLGLWRREKLLLFTVAILHY
jgi:hypothetical protein